MDNFLCDVMHMSDKILPGMPGMPGGMPGAMPGQPIQPFHPMVGAWPGQAVRIIRSRLGTEINNIFKFFGSKSDTYLG